MRKILLFTGICAALIFGAGSGPLFAQRGSSSRETVEVKLASPLPRESPWGRTLDRIAAEWSRITGGQVRLRVLHGGTEGGEEKMLLSLKGNTIQGALFTSFGLSSINPAIMTMSAPFFIRSNEELDLVMDEVQDDLETGINSGEYFIVAWSRAGFVNIFSKEPVLVPDDLKRQKIASNAEARDLNDVFKSMGFEVVETDWTDVGTKINSGAIMAIYQNPAAVAAFGMHTMLQNMLPINIAPVLGGIVVNQLTWNKINSLNPRYQAELLRVTRRIAVEFDASLQKTLDDAQRSMLRTGLKINRPNSAQEQLWYSEVEKAIPPLLGKTFDRGLYERISGILTRHRRSR